MTPQQAIEQAVIWQAILERNAGPGNFALIGGLAVYLQSKEVWTGGQYSRTIDDLDYVVRANQPNKLSALAGKIRNDPKVPHPITCLYLGGVITVSAGGTRVDIHPKRDFGTVLLPSDNPQLSVIDNDTLREIKRENFRPDSSDRDDLIATGNRGTRGNALESALRWAGDPNRPPEDE